MRCVIILCLFVAVAWAATDKYTDKYDNVDLNEILHNRRLLLPYIKCILDEGKCSADGKELKAHITEALQQDCSKCSEKQKKGAKRIVAHLVKNEPDYWNRMRAKYDPENTYVKKYDAELRTLA